MTGERCLRLVGGRDKNASPLTGAELMRQTSEARESSIEQRIDLLELKVDQMLERTDRMLEAVEITTWA